MKTYLYAFLSILFFIVMLCFPKETLSGATSGLLLWFQIVLPTLLPFFIITNLLIKTNSITYISRFCGPILQKIFCVSPDGSFAVLAGLLCGYPIGAKVTADLVRNNRITEEEGNYLLSFCNNTSPAFISGYLVLQNLEQEGLLIPTLLILYLSPIVCSFIFRRVYHRNKENCSAIQRNAKPYFSFAIVDYSILNAFENITKVGGYIILFSILLAFGQSVPFAPALSILEITNGIRILIHTFDHTSISYILTLALTSFGGICAIVQTKAMLTGTRLSILKYTIEKLITATVTSLLALLFILQ